MTFKEWATNPSGKGSAVMSTKTMYREMYAKKFNLIMLREGNKFEYHLFRGGDENSYYIHIKIPSEVIKNFYYDIVIEFTTANPAYAVSPSLDRYDIRVFSNSPDFTFTHAHAYNQAKLFFKDMETKIPKISIKNVAKERNPKDEIGYIKSIYFTYLIMNLNHLFDKTFYRVAPKYNKKQLLDNIMDAERKIALRQEEELKLKAESRKKKSQEIRKANEVRNVGMSSQQHNTKNITTTKRTGKTATSHTVKASKKI